IFTQPASQMGVQGSNATFSVVAKGSLPLHYRWTFNGMSIPWATGSSCSLANALTNYAGTYAVIVTNACGSLTSKNAVVSLVVPHTIMTHPASHTVVQRSNAALSVGVSGTAPFTYLWRRNVTNLLGQGTITTVAGNGTLGNCPNGGQASNACFTAL